MQYQLEPWLTSSVWWGSNLAESCTKEQAPAIKGENRLLQAHLAQPVSDRFHSTSSGVRPRKYLQHRDRHSFTQARHTWPSLCPTGSTVHRKGSDPGNTYSTEIDTSIHKPGTLGPACVRQVPQYIVRGQTQEIPTAQR